MRSAAGVDWAGEAFVVCRTDRVLAGESGTRGEFRQPATRAARENPAAATGQGGWHQAERFGAERVTGSSRGVGVGAVWVRDCSVGV